MNKSITNMTVHEPCWTREDRERTLTRIASLGDDNRDRFLATHTPFQNILRGFDNEKIREEAALSEILDFTTKEATVVVKGAPGTGKSHFINWLKIRCDYEQENDKLDNAVVVLIQRRTGSLKDTLEQLIDQLPKELHVYLEPVKNAIGQLSKDELKTRLAQSMFNYFTHRSETAPLPRRIEHLPQAFVEQGFGKWLTREGGAIDENVKLLTSSSEIHDRSSIPQFSSDDFLVQDNALRDPKLNTSAIRALIDEIEDDPDTLSLIVERCNAVLRDAVQELLGLNNTALTEIFNNIRRDLKKDGKKLILLIEDVSALLVLDHEVVNAVEPNSDNTLCQITSVLGMTEVAFAALRDNQTQRLSLVLNLPDDVSSTGGTENFEEADKFLGRYLNAIRMSDQQITDMVGRMQSSESISESACADCKFRESCHKIFGKIEIDDVSIGLYPFRENVISKLLENLRRDNQYGKTQRGLIEDIISPTLVFFEGISENRQPILSLPVDERYPEYFNEMSKRYLKNWDRQQLKIHNYLTIYWSNLTQMHEVMQDVGQLSEYFKLPKYSEFNLKGLEETQGTQGPIETQGTETNEKSREEDKLDKATKYNEDKYREQNTNLISWMVEENTYARPEEMQDHITSFLNNSLAYLFSETNPSAAFRKTIKFGRDVLAIEDMGKRSATFQNPFLFQRSDETRDFFDALLHFEFKGNRSWKFNGGEKYKRIAYVWLRKHKEQLLDVFAPHSRGSEAREKLDELRPLSEAVKILYLMKTISMGEKIPDDPAQLIELLFEKIEDFKPNAVSSDLLKLHRDLEQFSGAVRKFVLDEISQPQGVADSVKIIDPTHVIQTLSDKAELLNLSELDPGYFLVPSKARYAELTKLKQWKALPSALVSEMQEARNLIENIDAVLTKWGFKHSQNYEHLVEWYVELETLFDVARDILTLPNADLQVWYLGKSNFPPTDVAGDLKRINTLVETENFYDLLYYNTDKLAKFGKFLSELDAKLKYIENQCEQRTTVTIKSEDPSIYLENIRSDLHYIVNGEGD